MTLNFRTALLAAGVCLCTMAPFAAGFGTEAEAQEATFVIKAADVGAPTYNPPKASNLNGATSLIYDRLVERDNQSKYHPHLAESWEEAADGKSWVFHLRKDVKFHNGEPFNAEAVKAWLALFAGTDNAYLTEAIDKVDVVDENTVKFEMKHPDPNILYNLSSLFMGVVEAKAYAALGDKFGVTEAIGTGPYKLESFTVGQETVLVRNDDYKWGSELSKNTGPGKIARITFREIAEDSTAFLELKTGGVDMLLSVPTDYLGELAKEKNVGVLTLPGQEVLYMPMNVKAEPFNDIKVREGAAKAINQKEILASIYGGVGAAADTFLISSLAESKVADQYKISYNPDRAKAALDEAGWKMGPDGIRVKDGKPLKVTLWTQSDTGFRRLTEVVQAQLKAVGMDAEITTFDSSAIRDQYKSGKQQIAVRGYLWDNADIIDWFFGGDRLGYPNVSMFNDPKAEELRKKAISGSANMEERVKNFTAYHEYVLSQFPMAPIYQPVQTVGYNKDRLKVPETINSPQYQAAAIMDTEVIN